MSQETLLYSITAIMLLLVISFVYYVVSVSNIKRYVREKDRYYIERMDGLEAIIRTEFKAILESIKKHKL
jgi:hypothetical protein